MSAHTLIQNQDRDYLEERMNEIANNVRDEYDRAIEDLEAKIERLQEMIDHLVEKS